jgi:ubiquinone/menaquinone biosynthesis C-methylase UbiE
MLVARSLRSVSAVEPNDDMCGQEIETSKNAMIAWRKSSAEETGLPNGSIDLATMASSFHRLTSTRRTDEFPRILWPCGAARRHCAPNRLSGCVSKEAMPIARRQISAHGSPARLRHSVNERLR